MSDLRHGTTFLGKENEPHLHSVAVDKSLGLYRKNGSGLAARASCVKFIRIKHNLAKRHFYPLKSQIVRRIGEQRTPLYAKIQLVTCTRLAGNGNPVSQGVKAGEPAQP
jgi:hypothetical protein